MGRTQKTREWTTAWATTWTITALLAAGCGTALQRGDDDGGTIVDMAKPSKEPLIHRPTADACTATRAPFNCDISGSGAPAECSVDSECTQGQNGRCVGNPHDGCSCSYDQCVTDADCGSNQLCSCRQDWHYGAGGPNVCMMSNCRVDADCGAGGYCSPSYDAQCGAYFGVTGWFCHTKKDECVNDSDCAQVDGGWSAPFCGYRPEVGHWACSTTQCVG